MEDMKIGVMTQEMVKKLFTYCDTKGGFSWKERGREDFKTDRAFKTWNLRYSFKKAGTLSKNGYVHITLKINGLNYSFLEHRLVWLYFKGKFPDFTIDHINGDRAGNFIENLRDVPQSVNNRNSTRPRHNATGFVGTSFDKKNGRYNAHIYVLGKVKRIGRFDTLEQAVAARKRAEIKYDYHQNHGKVAA